MGGSDQSVSDKNIPDAHPKSAHEKSDVDLTYIVIFSLALVAMAFVVYIALWWMFDHFSVRQARLNPPPSALVLRGEQQRPPEPRLQGVPGHETQPVEDLERMRASEDAALNSYGWVDQTAGVVRIPIEQAKTLLEERGLPTRPPQEKEQ